MATNNNNNPRYDALMKFEEDRSLAALERLLGETVKLFEKKCNVLAWPEKQQLRGFIEEVEEENDSEMYRKIGKRLYDILNEGSPNYCPTSPNYQPASTDVVKNFVEPVCKRRKISNKNEVLLSEAQHLVTLLFDLYTRVEVLQKPFDATSIFFLKHST